MFPSIKPTPAERRAELPGDGVVPRADVVMDRAMTLSGPPATVWPWLVQLGKGRGGWYLPLSLERCLPRRRRALRSVNPRWQGLEVGTVIPDYGGREATFEVLDLQPAHHLVYGTERGHIVGTWSMVLTATETGTRLHFRLRLGGVRRVWLAQSAGGLMDWLTIAGLAAGLRERLLENTVRSG